MTHWRNVGLSPFRWGKAVLSFFSFFLSMPCGTDDLVPWSWRLFRKHRSLCLCVCVCVCVCMCVCLFMSYNIWNIFHNNSKRTGCSAVEFHVRGALVCSKSLCVCSYVGTCVCVCVCVCVCLCVRKRARMCINMCLHACVSLSACSEWRRWWPGWAGSRLQGSTSQL